MKAAVILRFLIPENPENVSILMKSSSDEFILNRRVYPPFSFPPPDFWVRLGSSDFFYVETYF